MGTKVFFKTILESGKTKFLKRESADAFAGIIHNCCKVSHNNHSIAFVIHRSVFGYPRLEQIDRPSNVRLSELDDCVIVKDGYVYELTRRVE